MKDNYFDLEIVGEDWFIDPYDLEAESIDYFGCSPDWEELYKDGFTAWRPKDDENEIVFYLSSNFYTGERAELCNDSETDDSDIDHKDIMCIGTECFGEICQTLLSMCDELLYKNQYIH